MKTIFRFAFSSVIAVVVGSALPPSAYALPVISNGGFEAGFASWTRANQVGSEGDFFIQTGTASPVNADSVPAPPQGAQAAMSDAQGPGSHVLYQDFVVSGGAANLVFALFVGNRGSDFFSPPTLDFSTPAINQQARVDIMNTGADPFSVAAADVLLNLYQTNPGDPLISGYNAITRDVTAFLAAHTGETLRLRFAQTDNLAALQIGIDNVRFESPTTAVPEPASALLVGTMLLALIGSGAAKGSRRIRG